MLDEAGASRTTTACHGLTLSAISPKNQTKTNNPQPGRVTGANSRFDEWHPLFAKDFWGDLTRIADPTGNIITVTYNNLGRKTGLHAPGLGWIY